MITVLILIAVFAFVGARLRRAWREVTRVERCGHEPDCGDVR